MSILFGHPTGNPNSHHAALAHHERGRLAAFVVPWMPSTFALAAMGHIPPLRAQVQRLARRRFEPLADAPKIQGRFGEFTRLSRRVIGRGDEGLAYEANDWVMRTMARACGRQGVTAVHAYEDAALWQFEAAKRRGQACIYDLPIGYYPAWESRQEQLAAEYRDWVPAGGLTSSKYARPAQKKAEITLADVVVAPSEFVRATVLEHVAKPVALAPYGIDTTYWRPAPAAAPRQNQPLVFLFAGQASIRKGTPLLLEAWRRAALSDATLRLVGTWGLADSRKRDLPPRCDYVGPLSRDELIHEYQRADVFVLPTFFEGRALVGGEAMACGLPLITTVASGVSDLVTEASGRLFEAGRIDELIETLRWFARHRDALPVMRAAARTSAERCTWEAYRTKVAEAVAPYV